MKRDSRYSRLLEQYTEAMMDLGETQAALRLTEQERDNAYLELAQIRGSMRTVSVYEGLVDASPLTMMVADLAKDHEELEARIDAALHYLSGVLDDTSLDEARREVHRLLSGGTRVPNTIEGLDG